MKKIILLLLVTVVSVSAMAQTIFRDISYKDAVMAAKAEKKLVFIDFYTSWCGPCKMMMKNIFPLREVGDYLNAKFVCIKIDAEKGEGPALAKRFGVKAYPTFIALGADEHVIMSKEGGSASGSDFVNSIDRRIDPDKTPERMQQRYESGERTASLVADFAGMKMEQVYQNRRPDMSKKDEAFEIVQEYFHGLKDEERLLEENLFVYTTFTESPVDVIARYMISNRDRFALAMRDKISERIRELYKSEIEKYLTAQIPFDREQYDEVKKGILELGLNHDHYYSEAFRLIECYGEGDLNGYMTLFENAYESLNDDYRVAVMYGYSRLFGSGDEAVKLRAAKFMRRQFMNMDATMIMFVAQHLLELEGGGH